MSTYERLERYARIIADHVDSSAKRQLLSEYLEALRRVGKLTGDEQSRLTAALLGDPGR